MATGVKGVSMEKTIYQRNGYKDRAEYLSELALDFDVPNWLVENAAELLGESEDFDGLLTTLEDYEGGF
jgi:hypothetical protein